MKDSSPSNTGVSGRTFDYPGRWRYFLWYLPFGILLFFVFRVLSSQGVNPWFDALFMLLFSLCVFDLLITFVLRMRAPTSFRITDDTLEIEWTGRQLSTSLLYTRIRKNLSRLFNHGKVISADSETFVVFADLRGYGEFLELCRHQGYTPSDEDSRPPDG
jgi:hypothetical protein